MRTSLIASRTVRQITPVRRLCWGRSAYDVSGRAKGATRARPTLVTAWRDPGRLLDAHPGRRSSPHYHDGAGDLPLTLAVYEHAVRAGAFPQVQFASAYLDRALLMHGSDELIARVPDLERNGMEWADVYIGLRGARNPHELAGIPPSGWPPTNARWERSRPCATSRPAGFSSGCRTSPSPRRPA